MSQQQVDFITDKAGTGAPNFPFGITISTPSRIRLTGSTGNGSTATVIRIFTTIIENIGTDITYATNAVNGDSFTINQDGIYAMTYTDLFSGAEAMGLSLNASSLT